MQMSPIRNANKITSVITRRGIRARRCPFTSLPWVYPDNNFRVLYEKGIIRTMATDRKPSLTLDNMNPNVKLMRYAVRGPLLIRVGEIEKELEQGTKKPFTHTIRGNIGDSHAMGQIPITFIRQVLALCVYPPLLENPIFLDDAKKRARELISSCKGCSVGSYTESPGIELIRRHVARYIAKRDGGIPSDWKNVVLCAGASDGIKNIIKLMVAEVDGRPPGVMIPIPQYPLYSATLSEFNVEQVGYYLDEANNWGLNITELQRSLDNAKTECINVRALVVINPGNPTGQVLTRQNIEDIIKFAYKEKLFLLADEVYQDNVYASDSKFYSFKMILTEMGSPYDKMELASFMSCSKGYMGECGIRGGYAEVLNMCPEVKLRYMKCISTVLCPTVLGQICVDTVVNPPTEGEPSYAQYISEKQEVLDSFKFRAKLVRETLNALEGFKCNVVQGALYAFPQIQMPAKAIEAAKAKNLPADDFYTFELLEMTGVCVVPGSGFGQQPGTYHFRTTILPQPKLLKEMLDKIATFHKEFIKKYK